MPQVDHLLPQRILGLQGLVDLAALTVPALHGKVELRGLQARGFEIRPEAAALEGAQPLLEPLPGTGENRHFLGQDGA